MEDEIRKFVEETQEVCDKATPGPWTQADKNNTGAWWGRVPDNAPEAVVIAGEPEGSYDTPYAICCTNDDGLATENEVYDAAFIAAARTALPRALQIIREQAEEIQKLKGK